MLNPTLTCGQHTQRVPAGPATAATSWFFLAFKSVGKAGRVAGMQQPTRAAAYIHVGHILSVVALISVLMPLVITLPNRTVSDKTVSPVVTF